MRIAAENVRKVKGYILRGGGKLAADNQFSLEMENGTRYLALPQNPENIRGLSIGCDAKGHYCSDENGSGGIVVVDESAYITDPAFFVALTPMLSRRSAVNRYILASTPNGQSGYFYEAFIDEDNGFKKIHADWTQATHLSPSFIEAERKRMSTSAFEAEWGASFVATGGTKLFSLDQWDELLGITPVANPTFTKADVMLEEAAPVYRKSALPNFNTSSERGVRFL